MLTLTKLQQTAKSVKIKNWWKMKKAELIAALKKHHTLNTEAELEFLINGGEIKKLPDAPDQIEANNDEGCAGFKRERKEPRKPRKAKKPAKKPAKKEAKKPTKAFDGYITTLAEICEELDVNPKAARRKLRASDLKKPAGGWKWASDDTKSIEEVKAIIK